MHETSKTRIMEATENQLNDAIIKCIKIIKSLKQNESMTHAENRREMTEYFLAARGVAIMQELALVIKNKEYGQNVVLISSPYELAVKLEYWLMDYCMDWRAVSRESELYRIKEFVWQICTILRKYK